jgi:hypothetical protein
VEIPYGNYLHKKTLQRYSTAEQTDFIRFQEEFKKNSKKSAFQQ